jgi:hypothetical protein
VSSYRTKADFPDISNGNSTYGFRLFGAVPNVPEWDGATSGTGVAAPISYDGRIIVTLAEAVDAPRLTFTTGGDNGVEWFATNDVKKTGSHSACSSSPGQAPRNRTVSSWMETSVVGAGTLSFFWRVSCEKDEDDFATYDRLMFFTNGVEVARIDGEHDWERLSVRFEGGGTNSVRWEFLKDDYEPRQANFSDCGWVDGVIWAPDALILIFR